MGLLERNLAKCGRSISIIKHSDIASGKSHRSRDRTQDVSTTTEGAFIDFSKFDIDGVDIKSSDQQVIVNAMGLPDLSHYDEIQEGAVLWKIKKVKIYRSKDAVLLYKFQVRR